METTVNTPFSLQRPVLAALCYFDVFAHPLTAAEILQMLSVRATTAEVSDTLELLLEKQLIAEWNGYYFLPSQKPGIVTLRKEKEERAKAMLEQSQRFTKLIARFPYVRAVCISGSLSKGVMDADGDVDYFVVAAPGRLWICRSLLILFKKLALFNSHKYFCTNYFLDTNSLEIPDKNIFTATEVLSLKAVVNVPLTDQLMAANNWTAEYLPNYVRTHTLPSTGESRNGLKTMLEWLLKGRAGEWFDTYLFRLTLRRWQKKFPHFTKEDFDLNMRTRRNVSKHHPRGYQQKVLDAYAANVKKAWQQIGEKLVVAA